MLQKGLNWLSFSNFQCFVLIDLIEHMVIDNNKLMSSQVEILVFRNMCVDDARFFFLIIYHFSKLWASNKKNTMNWLWFI